MSNRELFCVLTGDKGVMAQMQLQNVIRKYMSEHSEEADLRTMLRTVMEEEAADQ